MARPPVRATVALVIAVALAFTGCTKDKSTHSTSASLRSLKEKQAFVEGYVTFRRTYSALEFKIDFEDDTSWAPGPSATGCDVRLYAKVPEARVEDWIAGRKPVAADPPASELGWVTEIPSAPNALTGFVWYDPPSSPFGGSVTVGVRPSSPDSEVLYRAVCGRN